MVRIFRTIADAYSSLSEFTPELAALHTIVPATIGGHRVGYIRVLRTRKRQ